MSIRQIVTTLILVSLEAFLAFQPYKHTDPDFATSVHHLQSLALMELDFICSSLFLLRQDAENQEDIDIVLKDFTESVIRPVQGETLSIDAFAYSVRTNDLDRLQLVREIVKHPFKSYRLIRRYVNLWSKLPERTKHPGIQKQLELINSTLKFPKQSDLNVSMQSILRLKQIFQLSVSDLFTGKLGDLYTNSGLDIVHLYEIALHGRTIKIYTHAIDLLHGILLKCSNGAAKSVESCKNANLQETMKKLDDVIKEHDELVTRNAYDRSDLSIVPPDSSPYMFDRALNSISSENFVQRKKIQIDLEFEAFKKISNHSELELNMAASPFIFEKLCGGHLVKKNISTLICYYHHHTSAYYLIGPLKAEIYHDDPLVVQMYNVVTEAELSQLKSEVEQEMRQSRTAANEQGADVEIGKISRFRTSANAWIEDIYKDEFSFLNKKVSLITGLNTRGDQATEMVQIAAYNPGGHYTPHTDAMFENEILSLLPQTEIIRGDRIMTFMIYLSDVERGGGTVFPPLETVVQPVKGSAVIWYNLKPDGSINYDVLHGGCPVLYGTKWIANKWIRSNDQMFKRPCLKTKVGWKL